MDFSNIRLKWRFHKNEDTDFVIREEYDYLIPPRKLTKDIIRYPCFFSACISNNGSESRGRNLWVGFLLHFVIYSLCGSMIGYPRTHKEVSGSNPEYGPINCAEHARVRVKGECLGLDQAQFVPTSVRISQQMLSKSTNWSLDKIWGLWTIYYSQIRIMSVE